jgi:limonene 1,2-monooxygenase
MLGHFVVLSRADRIRTEAKDLIAASQGHEILRYAQDDESTEVLMPRLGFGAFLAPHHPIGENPTLQFRRDLKFVEHLDELGYDEFWCGEHHSSGWEMIASPEMFLAAAGERTKRIKLGTGVISLPYHHPYNVAQRMVQLDHMTGGRAIFGSGPGALPSDAHTLGIDPMVQRDRQDDAIGVIRRLFKGERVTAKTDWYTLQDAALQLLPLQEDMPFAVASQISPSGMTLAGKYGIGIISLGSMSDQGLLSLPTQWGFAEAAAKKHGTKVDRKNWRVLLSWHIAETREKAREEAKHGLLRWHNEYITGTLQRPGSEPFASPDEAVDKTAFMDGAASTIGTPDDLVKTIKDVLAKSGGFGTVIGFVHDWANPENTMRSWDMVARYVIPEINGYIAKLRESQKFLIDNRAVFDRAGQAIMAKIMENKDAAEALKVTESPRFAAASASVPKMPGKQAAE